VELLLSDRKGLGGKGQAKIPQRSREDSAEHLLQLAPGERFLQSKESDAQGGEGPLLAGFPLLQWQPEHIAQIGPQEIELAQGILVDAEGIQAGGERQPEGLGRRGSRIQRGKRE
jgi:hypothetical protein